MCYAAKGCVRYIYIHGTNLWMQPVPGRRFLREFLMDISDGRSLVIDDITSKSNVSVAYIYFDYKDSDAQSVDNVIRSLLKQLLCASIVIPQEVESVYNDARKQFKDPDTLTFTRLLQLVAASNSGNVFIVFDALDECGSTKVRDFVITLICQLKEAGAKGLCTSRPHLTDLAKRLDTTAILPIEAKDQDIENYVSTVLSNWPYAERLKIKIIDRLASGAKGK